MRKEQRTTQAELKLEATPMTIDQDKTVRSSQKSTAEFKQQWGMQESHAQIETKPLKQLEQQYILWMNAVNRGTGRTDIEQPQQRGNLWTHQQQQLATTAPNNGTRHQNLQKLPTARSSIYIFLPLTQPLHRGPSVRSLVPFWHHDGFSSKPTPHPGEAQEIDPSTSDEDLNLRRCKAVTEDVLNSSQKTEKLGRYKG